MKLKIVAIVLVLFGLSSCGTFRSVSVKGASYIIFDASYSIETEKNWENFRNGVTGNLMLLESLLFLDPENDELLISLIKGYVGLGFVVNETMALDLTLQDEDESEHHKQAIRNYSKAMEYGIRYLKKNEISYMDMMRRLMLPNGIYDLLNDKFDPDNFRELEGVIYTAQALTGLISLQKDKVAIYSQLPIAQAMFDWVCSKKIDINYGTCDIFYGAHYSALPKSLGGGPAKGKGFFLSAIKKYPENWFIRTAFMQFYLIPFLDHEGFREQSQKMDELVRAFKKDSYWLPNKMKDPLFANPKVGLYQALAVKRYQIMKKYEKEIFE